MATVTETVHGRRKRTSAVRPWGTWGLRSLALIYLTLMIIVPLATVASHGLSDGLDTFWSDLNRFGARQALLLTLWTAAFMTAINVVMGTLTAYVLVRYSFPGKSLLNALIDMPIAIPTLVTGIMIIVLLGPQSWLGGWFAEYAVRIVFAWPAIVLALLFVTFPLTVRAVQPVLEEVDIDQEEAAHSLGASQWQTFWRVLLPALSPAIISGGLLTFARALGEFGSIVIVSGNIPARTLTAPVHIFGEIEAGNARSASAMSLVLIAIAVTTILFLDWFQHRRLGKHHEAEL